MDHNLREFVTESTLNQIGWYLAFNGSTTFSLLLKDAQLNKDDECIQNFIKICSIVYCLIKKKQFNDSIKLVNVKRNSTEWVLVQNKFRQTLTVEQIINIQCIRNTSIERYYKLEKENFQKRGKPLNEVLLWHGSRKTDPKLIYQGDKHAFDIRFANEGWWGYGYYFAQNANYSTNYAHRLANGQKQMFLCNVILGESVEMKPDNTLKIPPIKDQTNNLRYDSVKGDQYGQAIYIIYDNNRIYPTYLITYK